MAILTETDKNTIKDNLIDLHRDMKRLGPSHLFMSLEREARDKPFIRDMRDAVEEDFFRIAEAPEETITMIVDECKHNIDSDKFAVCLIEGLNKISNKDMQFVSKGIVRDAMHMAGFTIDMGELFNRIDIM